MESRKWKSAVISLKSRLGRPSGFTLLEVTMGLAVTAVCMAAGTFIFSSSARAYRYALADRSNLASLEVLDSLVSNDIHGAAKVNGYGSQVIIAKSSSETDSYWLNAAGKLVRQVNGQGGEIVAANLAGFSAITAVPDRSIQITVDFASPVGVQMWELQYSIGH